jgi:type I restriction enzyme, S subunit
MGMNEISLSDVFDLQQGFAFKSKDFQSAGIPILKIKNVKSSGLSLHKLDYVEETFLDSHSKYVPEKGDALISMSGNRLNGSKETWVGKVSIFDQEEPFLVNQRVGILKNKNPQKVNTKFVAYALSSDYWQLRFAQTATSSGGQANLSSTQILSETIELPEFFHQEAIAYILGTLDDKIELNQKMNETLEEIAKAISKSWFVDFDPVRAKKEGRPTGLPDDVTDLFPDELVDSEIGEVPKGWEDRKLGEIVKEVGTKTKPSEQTRNSPYVPIDKIHSKSLALYDHSDGAEAKSSLVRFRKRDILFGAMRPYFHKVCVAPFEGTTRTTCLVLNSIQPEFYAFSLMTLFSDSTIDFATQNSTGSTIPYIKWRNELETLRVATPSLEIAAKVNGILEPIVDRFSMAIRERQTLSELRDTLLPKLISGELLIPDAEKFLEEAGI